MSHYTGTIIEESLEDKAVLEKVKIVSTRVEQVCDRHKTPWLGFWTIHEIHVPITKGKIIAQEISHSIDQDDEHHWYADFKNKSYHYIIYRDKVFCVDRSNDEQYHAAMRYGAMSGIPIEQLNFLNEPKK